MKIERVIRRGSRNTRVLMEDGAEKLVPNDQLRPGPKLVLPPSAKAVQTTGPSVQERFENMENLVSMVIAGQSPSLIICGDAGIGKTYMVRQRLKQAGLDEQVVTADDKGKKPPTRKRRNPFANKKGNSYLFVKGYSSPMGLYQVLHDNRSSTIVFDDCDSVFKTPVSVNILKSALDSYDIRIVSWVSPAAAKMGLDQSFEFKGKVIFISNLLTSSLDEAVKSRSFVVDVTLTRKEIWDRMVSLLPNIEPKVDMSTKDEVVNFLGFNLDKFVEFNIRTFIKAVRIRQSGNPNWKEMVLKFA